ncbi:MAG: NAD(P)H-dependent oxidoreductase [Clostridia bacterium]|nr:NAD(P)H-dependent oxidoreductase [Clostridia bacterium]
MKILFVNACVRENSRTKELSSYLLSKLSGNVTEVDLTKGEIHSIDALDIFARDFGAAYCRVHAEQFAEADIVVIAAPYWDMSFPAILKEYIENICVSGVTFRYENDRPIGLCKAKKLYYVTTAGGPFMPDFGFNYIDALAKNFYGIPETKCFYAEGLDIYGADVDCILSQVKREIDNETLKL